MNHRSVLGAVMLLVALVLPAHSTKAQTALWSAATSTGITISGHDLTLSSDAAPAPSVYGSFTRFGLFDAQPQTVATTRRVRVTWTATIPAASQARVDVRLFGSGRWSDWTLDVRSGDVVAFDRTGTQVQARIVLLANADAPTVHSLHLEALPLLAGDATFTLQETAPTYHIRATRMGLVGDRTANGHIIQPNDWFVSLPSFRSLSSKGGYEYQARLSYKGRSIVVPVWEVGPWNIHDDYWNVNREKFADLPVGWPQDHAAYFDGYNGGWAEKGRVRFPTAADVGDGAWTALGIPFNDEQEEIDITFLWLGSDPGENPAPQPVGTGPGAAPAAPPAPDNSIVIDSTDGGFSRSDAPWYTFSCGRGKHSYWTYSTPDHAESTNSGRWTAQLAAGSYDVSVFVPYCPNGKKDTRTAKYVVEHADGSTMVTVNQATTAGSWVTLGRYRFDGSGSVQLTDLTEDSMRAVWFDAMRWTPAP